MDHKTKKWRNKTFKGKINKTSFSFSPLRN